MMGFSLQVDDALSLRLIEPHHAEELYAVADANREHLARYMPWMAPRLSLDDVHVVGHCLYTMLAGEWKP